MRIRFYRLRLKFKPTVTTTGINHRLAAYKR